MSTTLLSADSEISTTVGSYWHPSFKVVLSVPGAWEDLPTLRRSDVPFDGEDYHQLSSLVGTTGIRHLYIPNPSRFNGEVLTPDQFATDPVETFCHAGGTACLWGRNRFADGCLLPSGKSGGMFRASGCPMIVAGCGDKLAYAHGGFYCLIDRGYIASNRIRGRRWPSVIDSLLFALGAKTPKERRAVHLWVFYSIRPEDFFHTTDHCEHGVQNLRLKHYLDACGYTCYRQDGARLHFNLPRLIREQALSRGVPDTGIHIFEEDNVFLPKLYPTTRRGSGSYMITVVRLS